MKEIIINNNTYLFVEVPDDFVPQKYGALDARNNCIWGKSNNTAYTVSIHEKDFSIPYNDFGKQLEIISTTKDITEEQAKSIVEHKDLRYKNYKTFRWYSSNKRKSFRAKDSLQSLIQANGLDINKNYLILKKIETNIWNEVKDHWFDPEIIDQNELNLFNWLKERYNISKK